MQGGAAQRTRVQSIGHTGQHSPGGGGRGFGHVRHCTAEQSGGGPHTGQHSPGGGGLIGLAHPQNTTRQSCLHTGQHSPGGGGRGFGHSFAHNTAEQSGGGHTGQHSPGGGGRGLSHGGLMQAMLQTKGKRENRKN